MPRFRYKTDRADDTENVTHVTVSSTGGVSLRSLCGSDFQSPEVEWVLSDAALPCMTCMAAAGELMRVGAIRQGGRQIVGLS